MEGTEIIFAFKGDPLFFETGFWEIRPEVLSKRVVFTEDIMGP